MMHKVYRIAALLSMLAVAAPLARAEEETVQPPVETELKVVHEEAKEENSAEVKEEAKEATKEDVAQGEAVVINPFDLEYWKCFYENEKEKIKTGAIIAVPTVLALLGWKYFPRTNAAKKPVEVDGRPTTGTPLPTTPKKCAETSSAASTPTTPTTPTTSGEGRYPKRVRTPTKY